MNTPGISRSIRTFFGPPLIALLCGFTAGPNSGASLMFHVSTIQVGEGPTGNTAIAVGDFNGDGRSDLVVATSSKIGPPLATSGITGDGVSVLLGLDDGTFGPRMPLQAGSYPLAIVVGDFNGDGHQDLVVVYQSSDDICVFLGHGDGTFSSEVCFAAGHNPHSMAIGDFNEDGHQDLAVANSSGSVSILLGIGNGTFRPQTDFAVGALPNSIAVGDFNGDGRQDLVVANGLSKDISVFLGRGDGTFGSEARFAAGQGPRSVAVGDFNGDGRNDVAVANISYTVFGSSVSAVSILLGQGDGTFATKVDYEAGEGPVAVALGDFNDDGQQDLAVADVVSGEISVLLGHGDGTFGSPISCGAGDEPSALVPGHFNRDGRLDLAVSNNGGVAFALLGRGDGSFITASRYRV